MNTWTNQGTIGNKSAHRYHVAWNCFQEMHFCIKDKQWISIEEGVHYNISTYIVSVLEKNQIWVALSVGTLVINEGGMLKGIHVKLVVHMY
jgi:hypothetical protein